MLKLIFKHQNLDQENFKKYFTLNEITNHYEITSTAAIDGFYLDSFIKDSMYNGYSYEVNATKTCAETIATYMCSYTFIEIGTKPCVDLCKSVIECIPDYTYSDVKITPVLDTCESEGENEIETNRKCSIISLLNMLYKWTPLTDETPYPRGPLKGSFLAFGVLCGLLSVIGSMSIIMKVQDKNSIQPPRV